MLNLYIIIISAVLLGLCTFSLVYQAIYSAYFRKKIASEHNFTEGIMTGASYPSLWIVYGITLIQFISFIAFAATNEIVIAFRLLGFAVSVLVFYALKSHTPPLLALWFGKTAFWDNRGEGGKHLYSAIYGVKVHKKKNSAVINSQQIYKITFFVKGKSFLLIPKKYSCKMTAHQISSLADTVNFKDSEKPKIKKRKLIYSILTPILIFLIATCLFMQATSVGIFNTARYVEDADGLSAPSSEKVETVSEITRVVTNGARLYVYYENIGVINVYNTDGSFAFSFFLPHSVLKATDFTYDGSQILYRYGNELIRYSTSGEFILKETYQDAHIPLFDACEVRIGDKVVSYDSYEVMLGDTVIVERPALYPLFTPYLIWPITVLLTVALFVLRLYTFKTEEQE